MFGFGKKKELKEFEERLDTLIKLWLLCVKPPFYVPF